MWLSFNNTIKCIKTRKVDQGSRYDINILFNRSSETKYCTKNISADQYRSSVNNWSGLIKKGGDVEFTIDDCAGQKAREVSLLVVLN